MASGQKWTPKKREQFLESLALSGNVSKSAKSVGMSRSWVYELRSTDKDFRAEWDEAVEEGIDSLEEEARRRAFEGIEKGVWHQGVKVGVQKEYSDTLMIFLLKGRRPDVFKERIEREVEQRFVVSTSPELTADEWQEKHGKE